MYSSYSNQTAPLDNVIDFEEEVKLVESFLYNEQDEKHGVYSNSEKNEFINVKDKNKSKSFSKIDSPKDLTKTDKAKAVFSEIKELTKSLYQMKDEDFIEKKFFPSFTRLIARMCVVAAIGGTLGPFAGVVAFVTDRYIKNNTDVKQRQRLADYYQSRIEYVNDKMNDNDITPEEKYRLNKIKITLNNNLKKVSVYNPNKEERD